MHRRSATQTVGTNLSTAIDAAGQTVSSVALATDMPVSDLAQRLEGSAATSVAEALRVGGFLRMQPSAIFKEVSV